jgi:hypothetical protein
MLFSYSTSSAIQDLCPRDNAALRTNRKVVLSIMSERGT